MTLLDDPRPATLAPSSSDGIDERVTCTRVEDVTHDVKSFVLTRPGGASLSFDAGQYLTVTVEVDGHEVQRCYTISSSPTRPEELTITVKRVPGGPVSSWLHDRLGVGDSLWVSGPYGRFTLTGHSASKVLLLSAGSGITPLMSMTRMLHDLGRPADVVFVHSARTPADIVFRRELAAVAARPGFAVAAVCEEDSPDERWEGPTGRLSLRTLLRLAPDLRDREVFTCGPAGYMAAVREALALAGVDPARCHEESFVLEDGAVAASPSGLGPDRSALTEAYAVEFRRSGRTVECRSDESILSAALRAGLRPPSMCTEGMCGTCKTSLLVGDVEMRHSGGIRPREIEQGRILLCCSTPQGDVSVDA